MNDKQQIPKSDVRGRQASDMCKTSACRMRQGPLHPWEQGREQASRVDHEALTSILVDEQREVKVVVRKRLDTGGA